LFLCVLPVFHNEHFKGLKPNLPWVDSSVFRKAKREEAHQKKLDL
jgi:hypothetical protein